MRDDKSYFDGFADRCYVVMPHEHHVLFLQK